MVNLKTSILAFFFALLSASAFAGTGGPTGGGGGGGGGHGTVNAGGLGNPSYYATAGTAVSPVANIIHAGSGTLAAAFAACPGTGNCEVIADPGQTYTVDKLFIGSAGMTAPQTLYCDGATITANGTGGVGDAGLVINNSGHLIGNGRQNCSIGSTTTFNGDAIVESHAGYTMQNGGGLEIQPNMDVEGVSIFPNPNGCSGAGCTATYNKAPFWISNIDGFGYFQNLYVGAGVIGTPNVLVDDGPIAGGLWNNLVFNGVWVGIGFAKYGLEAVCAQSGGSNLTFEGGGLVDGNANTTAHMFLSGNGCDGFTILTPYLESASGEAAAGIGLSITNASSIVAKNLIFNSNGANFHNCIQINSGNTATADLAGRSNAGDCSNTIVTNSINGYTMAHTGGWEFDYSYRKPGTGYQNVNDGMNGSNGSWTTNTNLTGTDTISLAANNAKYTLTANEALTIQAGTNVTAAAVQHVRQNFEICQNGTGNFTLSFAAGTGISNIYWGSGGQPNNTLTASNGDIYGCDYDGTNLRCQMLESNQPC